MEISPAYNADKEKRGKKKKKKVEEEESREVELRDFQDYHNGQEIQPIQMPPPEDTPEFPSLSFRKKPTSYV